MAAKRFTLLLISGITLTACFQVAPSTPNFVIKYSGESNPEVPPPGPVPEPQPEPGPPEPENKPLPTAEEIQLAPVESGIALYSFYCSSCHRPYEESSKRDIGLTGPQIRDPYVMNFPKHRDRPWPKDEYEAYGIEMALKVKKGTDPLDKSSEKEEDDEKDEDQDELPSLDPPEEETGSPVLGG